MTRRSAVMQDFEEHFEGLSAGDTTAVYDVYKQVRQALRHCFGLDRRAQACASTRSRSCCVPAGVFPGQVIHTGVLLASRGPQPAGREHKLLSSCPPFEQADISKTCGEPQLPAKLQALSELCQQRARPAGSATGYGSLQAELHL